MTKDRLPAEKKHRDRVPDELDDLSRFEGEGGREAPVLDLAESGRVGASNEEDSMKLHLCLAGKDRGRLVSGAAKPTQRTGESEAPATTGVLDHFRRLKWNETVSRGDFVADGDQGFEPWEGPSGFRADAFVKPIYRRRECRPVGTKKLK